MKAGKNLIAAAMILAALAGGEATAQQTAQNIGTKAEAPTEAQPAAAEDPAAVEQKRLDEAKKFYDSLDRKTGEVSIVNGKVRLNIPDTHYFVGPTDARRILVDTWGNPKQAADNVEGMIFPKDGNPALDSWGAVIEYQADGHVSDDDAAKIDYTKLLKDMKADVQSANEERQKQGYPAVELVDWAEPPHYDAQSKKLYWAKTLQFSGSESQTLNYDIRVLGRDGVLVISFVSGMNQLADIKAAAPGVLAMPSFSQGAQYTDYREGVDKKAAYGIAGLIAGGAAVALAKKAGLIGLIILYGKKFIILVVAGFAAIGNFFRRMFGGKPKDKQ